MSLRFRRTMKIAPGLRLNVTKRGLSISAGVRGAHVTFGTSGARVTAGIPGSGLFLTEKLGGREETALRQAAPDGVTVYVSTSNELRKYITSGLAVRNAATGRRCSAAQLESMLRKLERQEEFERSQSEVSTEERAYRRTVDIHLETLPIPSETVWQKRLQSVAFSRDEFDEPPPVKKDIEFKTSKRINEENKLPAWDWTIAFPLLLAALAMGILAGGMPSLGLAVGVLAIASATWSHVRIRKRRNTVRQTLDELAAREATQTFERLTGEWGERMRTHLETMKELEAEHCRAEELRVSMLRQAMAGDLDAIQCILKEEFESIDVPFETEVSVEVPASECVFLDVDLPEIEDCILPVIKKVLKSGKVSERSKPKKIQDEEYARLTTGFAFYLSSQVFNCSPTTNKVVVSGYTQRTDKSTGNVTDQYIYSIVVDKDTFASINFQEADPIRCFSKFQVGWKMSASFVFSPVTPFQPDELS